MKNILFLTDFSKTEDNGFIYALDIAKATDATLNILHVYSSVSGKRPLHIKQLINSQTNFDVFQEFEQPIKHLYNLAIAKGHTETIFSINLQYGDLLSQTYKLISKDNNDFLVIGTDGEAGLHRKLFGTTLLNIIESIKIPILAIPHAVTKYEVVKNVGFTTKFTLSDLQALMIMVKYSEEYNTQLKCLHITNDMYAPELTATIDYWTKTINSDHLEFVIMYKGKASYEDLILDFIKEQHIDYLCIRRQSLPTLKRLLEPSLTDKLLKKIDIPLYIVKEEVL
ncbi:MAG TPA: universal stress protein [Flavobacterium sp.]|nr:universal stress protein [Flavobacterium sp.]